MRALDAVEANSTGTAEDVGSGCSGGRHHRHSIGCGLWMQWRPTPQAQHRMRALDAVGSDTTGIAEDAGSGCSGGQHHMHGRGCWVLDAVVSSEWDSGGKVWNLNALARTLRSVSE